MKLWLQLLNELQAYVKQNHTTGVVWNSQKKSASFDPSRVGSSTTTNGSVATPGGPGGPPPPPPPPNFNFNEDTDDQKKSSAATTQALFSAINKGTLIVIFITVKLSNFWFRRNEAEPNCLSYKQIVGR